MTNANQPGKLPPKSAASLTADDRVALVIDGHEYVLESPLREQIFELCRPAFVLANLDKDTSTQHVTQAAKHLDL